MDLCCIRFRLKIKIDQNQIKTQIKLRTIMSGTRKIQNDHPDEEVLVDDSQQISSQSDENVPQQEEQQYEPERKQRMEAGQRLGGVMYDENKSAQVEGGYDPMEFSDLPVSGDVKDLFKMIQRYQPITMDIDTKVRAFVPDFIPTVGEVDAFLKMPRPDGQPEHLGLNVLDEPCLNQSDLAKIGLLFRNRGVLYNDKKVAKVHAIEEAERHPKKITDWVNSVNDIQKDKQPPSVNYSKQMPDIDSLMQVWPAEVEQMLSDITIPSQELDLSLEEYCRVACNILDIPVMPDNKNSSNVVESLHVMFTLYSAFKENQHFQMNQDMEEH